MKIFDNSENISELVVNLRQRVELDCDARGSPPPEMLWWRAGRAVTGDNNTAVVSENGTAGRFNDGPRLVIKVRDSQALSLCNRTFAYAIKNQRKTRNAPSRWHWVP